MATGGPPGQQQRGSRAAEDQLVQPTEDRCPAHISVPVVHLLYCRACGSPLCAQCWGADHEDHNVVPLTKQQEVLNQSLQRCVSQLRDRKKDSAAVKKELERDLGDVLVEEQRREQLCRDEHGRAMTRLAEEYRRKEEEEVKRYKAQLSAVKKELGGKAQELQTAVTQVADDAGDVETLLTQLRLLTLTAPVDKVTIALHAAEAALLRPTPGDQPSAKTSPQQPGPPPAPTSGDQPSAKTSPQKPGPLQAPTSIRHADMRQQLQAVAAEVQKDGLLFAFDFKDPVVVLNTSRDALLDYASGESDRPPGPLQGPDDAARAYNIKAGRYISGATAGAAAAVLGPAVLPRDTERHGGSVLTLGGQPQHVHTLIHERPGDEVTYWWVPAGVTVGGAAALALGYTPRQVTAEDNRRGEDISGKNMLAFRDETGTNDLYVWSREYWY